MSKACIVPFFKYQPAQRGNYRVLFEYFLKHLKIWAPSIDHLYLIDSGNGLTAEDDIRLNQLVKTTVYHIASNSHWGNLNKYLPQITEDKFMLIDSDTIIYRASIVDDIFNKLDDNDIVSMTDGSGGVEVFNKFSAFAANANRDKRRRFAPYLFAAKRKLFDQIGAFDFTPTTGNNWTDSMGTVTEQLLALNPRFHEIPDDRASIYYVSNGMCSTSAFLDGAEFNWSKTIPNDYGYYHVRNFNGGLYLVETKALDDKSYRHQLSIMPRTEAFRLLMWLWIMSDAAYQSEILSVVNDFGTTKEEFLDYKDSFYKFHSWVGAV